MVKLKRNIIFPLIAFTSINITRHASIVTNNNLPIEITRSSTKQSVNPKTYKSAYGSSANVLCENLSNLNREIFQPEAKATDIILLTELYIKSLHNHIRDNKDLECIKDNTGINIISTANFESGYEFRLIIYDGNTIGYGTLEKTWVFLQILSGSNIETYTLFNKSAELPLFIKVLELPNKNHIISIAGVTNISRSNTVFICFWEKDPNGLREYTNIIYESISKNETVYGNEYYIELFDDNNVKIIDAIEKSEFYYIIGRKVNISLKLQDNVVIIDKCVEVDDS